MASIFSNNIVLGAVASVGGIVAIVITVALFFFTLRYLRRSKLAKNLLIHPFWITEVRSQNWIWPELLQQTKTSAGDLLKEFQANNNETDVVRENGPRASDSAAQFVTIKANVPFVQGKFLVQKYKLKQHILTVPKKKTISQRLWTVLTWNKKTKVQVKDEESHILTTQIQFRRRPEQAMFLNIKDLRHNNILPLLHVAFEGETAYILYKVAGKNTLGDVILSRRFPFHATVQQSLIQDLLKGVSFIALKTSFKSHGNLNPRTVYIDDYWTLKIGGFGFSSYMEGCHPMYSDAYDSRIFVAPELLEKYPHQKQGTDKGDIYSVAMLMFTIHTGLIPFSDYKKDNLHRLYKKIASDLKSENRPTLPSTLYEGYQNIIQLSWSHNPYERPDIQTLIEACKEWDDLEDKHVRQELGLQKKFSRKERSTIDLARYSYELEQYIRNIEAAYTNQSVQILSHALTNVEKESLMSKKAKELSSQLSELQEAHQNELKVKDESIQALKKKFENDLLQLEKQMMGVKYSLLPPPLFQVMMDSSSKRLALDTLLTKAGANVVDLERNIHHYENATVTFVSIAGFNQLVTQFLNSPHLLLELLNQYYYAIEKICQEVGKVYIVEKICDTCVLVSGAPDRYPKHLELSAMVAIKVKNWFQKWDASWILGGSEEKMMVKIGIHSGPIVGGVIGNIPRFLVMSPTVNIASGIESSTKPQEIRMSAISQSMLTHNSQLRFENRGQIDLGPLIGKIWTFALMG